MRIITFLFVHIVDGNNDERVLFFISNFSRNFISFETHLVAAIEKFLKPLKSFEWNFQSGNFLLC